MARNRKIYYERSRYYKKYLGFLPDKEKIEFLKLYPHTIKYTTVSREVKKQLPGLAIAKKTGLLGLQNAKI